LSIFGSGKVIYYRIAALFCNTLLPTGSKSDDLQRKGQSLNMLLDELLRFLFIKYELQPETVAVSSGLCWRDANG
jgi:hypothetical protein